MKTKQVCIKELKLSELKTLDFDRKVNPKQVDALLRSLQKYGLLRLIVVLETKAISGTKEYYTIDGKHVKYAMIKLGIETASCIVYSCEDLQLIVETMAALNNTQLSWTTDNYVMAFRTMMLSAYNDLYLYHLANGFTYNVCATVLGSTSTVKKGTFKVTNKDAKELTDCMLEVNNLLGTSSAKFMLAYIMFFRSPMKDKYDHKKFMRKLSVVRKDFPILDDTGLMKANLEELYSR